MINMLSKFSRLFVFSFVSFFGLGAVSAAVMSSAGGLIITSYRHLIVQCPATVSYVHLNTLSYNSFMCISLSYNSFIYTFNHIDLQQFHMQTYLQLHFFQTHLFFLPLQCLPETCTNLSSDKVWVDLIYQMRKPLNDTRSGRRENPFKFVE